MPVVTTPLKRLTLLFYALPRGASGRFRTRVCAARPTCVKRPWRPSERPRAGYPGPQRARQSGWRAVAAGAVGEPGRAGQGLAGGDDLHPAAELVAGGGVPVELPLLD